MTFSSVTSLGSASSAEGGGNPAIVLFAEAVPAGRLVLVSISKKNASDVDGTTSEILGITDTRNNSWRSAGRFCNSEGAVNAGIYVDLWYSLITNALSVGDAIGVNKSTDLACAVFAHKVTMTETSIASSVPVTRQDDDSSPGSLSTSGLANVHHLHIRLAAAAGLAGGIIPTAGWFSMGSASIGFSLHLTGEFRISTSTGETSAPVISGTTDSASVLVAFGETAIHDRTTTFNGAGSMSSTKSLLKERESAFSGVGSLSSVPSAMSKARTSAFSGAGSMSSVGAKGLKARSSFFQGVGSMLSDPTLILAPLRPRKLIMLEGSLRPASNLATWTERIELYDAETGHGIDLVEAIEWISLALRDIYTGEIVLHGDTDDGSVSVINPGIIEWSFTPEEMSGLDPKSYDVGCLLKMSTESIQILLGQVSVRRGL